jgi:hypothetical protein
MVGNFYLECNREIVHLDKACAQNHFIFSRFLAWDPNILRQDILRASVVGSYFLSRAAAVDSLSAAALSASANQWLSKLLQKRPCGCAAD